MKHTLHGVYSWQIGICLNHKRPPSGTSINPHSAAEEVTIGMHRVVRNYNFYFSHFHPHLLPTVLRGSILVAVEDELSKYKFFRCRDLTSGAPFFSFQSSFQFHFSSTLLKKYSNHPLLAYFKSMHSKYHFAIESLWMGMPSPGG